MDPQPNLLTYLIENRRQVSNDNGELDEIIYTVCAHTGLEFDQAQEVTLLLFEEIISQLLLGNPIRFFFGNMFFTPKKQSLVIDLKEVYKNELEEI